MNEIDEAKARIKRVAKRIRVGTATSADALFIERLGVALADALASLIAKEEGAHAVR